MNRSGESRNGGAWRGELQANRWRTSRQVPRSVGGAGHHGPMAAEARARTLFSTVLASGGTATGSAMDRTVGGFDRLVDERFEALRGRPLVDRVMYTATIVGEDGRIWLAIAALLTLRRSTRRRGLRALVWLGIETVLVNGPIKAAVGRERPDGLDEHAYAIRVQKTSSFPSGHSASSATVATILSEGSRWAPLWWAIALTIAVSRVHVRDHHPSDVAGGLLIGTGLGLLGRRLGPRDAVTGGERSDR